MHLIPFDTADDTEDNLGAIAKIIQTGAKYSSKRTQLMTADLLVKLSDSLAASANESGMIVTESRLEGDGRDILVVVGEILDMQEETPVSEEKDVDANDQIAESLQKTVNSVGDALLVGSQPGEVISVDTPKVELKAVKTTGAEHEPESLAFSNVTVDLPKGIGGDDSVSAVATPANPLLSAPTDFASGLITLTTKRPMN